MASDAPTRGAADNGGTDLKTVSSCLVASPHPSFACFILKIRVVIISDATSIAVVSKEWAPVCYLQKHGNRTGLCQGAKSIFAFIKV